MLENPGVGLQSQQIQFIQQRNASKAYRLVGKANEDDPKTFQTVLSITFINISSADHQMRLERFFQLRSALDAEELSTPRINSHLART